MYKTACLYHGGKQSSKSSSSSPFGCVPVQLTNADGEGGESESESIGGAPQRSEQKQVVKVVVRSWEDPFLKAEELTEDKFDFGMSPSSQRNLGLVLVGIGLMTGVMPLIRLRDAIRGDAEEARSLRCGDFEDEERGGGAAALPKSTRIGRTEQQVAPRVIAGAAGAGGPEDRI